MPPNDPVRIDNATEFIASIVTAILAGGVAQPGDRMDLVNAPNAIAIAAIQAGLAQPGDQMALTAATIAAIQAGLATAAALAVVDADTSKIDDAATNGLLGVDDSLAYRVNEIERHMHNAGYWYGKDPGDTFLLQNGLVSWQLTAGAGGAFGNWVQLSNGDEVANPRYDPHLILITQASAANNTYLFQFGTGEGGAQAVITTLAHYASASLRQAPIDVICPRVTNTSKLWARCACTSDGATMSFLLGIHTYVG